MWNFERTYSVSFVPPRAESGTHGWMVVFGVALVFIFNVSLLPTFSLIFQPIFESSDTTSVTFATYIFEVVTNTTVLLTGFLLKDLSAKHFVMIGSSLVLIGLLFTSIVRDLGQLILTYGIFIGIGLGLLNPASFISVLSCFQQSRNKAIGIVFAAMGLGQMVMPILAKVFLEHLNYRATIICIAALSAIGLVGSHLLPPIKWRNHCESNSEEEQRLLISSSSPSYPSKKFVVVREIIRASDLDLLSDYKYLLISISLSFIFALSTDFTKILPVLLMEKLRLSSSQSHICLNVINLSDVLARATFSFVSDAMKLSSKTVFVIGIVGILLFRVIVLHASLSFGPLLFFCVLFGSFRALTVVNQILIIADFCKRRCPRKLPGTLGLSFVIKSIFLTLFAYFYQKVGEDFSLHIYSHIILQVMIIFVWSCCINF